MIQGSVLSTWVLIQARNERAFSHDGVPQVHKESLLVDEWKDTMLEHIKQTIKLLEVDQIVGSVQHSQFLNRITDATCSLR